MSAVVEKSVAIVGLGAVARSYLSVMSEFPELVLKAVVEPGDSSVPAGARHFPSVTDMLRSGVIPQLALICTPPATHSEQTEPLLRASVDVLVETPLASTPHEADRISSLAERGGRVALTAGQFRGLPCVAEVRRLLADGAIGRLCYLEVTLAGKQSACEGWRMDPELAGGGVWMEYGPHCLDLVEALAGPVQRIRMVRSEHLQDAEVEDEARVETEHEAGLISAIRVSWNELDAAPVVRCVGERGELVIGWAQTLLRDEAGLETVIAGGCDEREAFRNVLERFLRAVRNPERFSDHGAQTVAWLHAAYRSQRGSRWELA